MKAKIFICLAFLLLSGCGSKNKEITCSLKQEDNGFSSVTKTTVSFKNDKITDYTVSTNTNVPDEYVNSIDVLLEKALEPYEQYKDLSGVTINSKTKKNSIYIELSVNTNKIKDGDKDKINDLLDLSSDYKTIKNSFELLDYECK